MLSRKLYSRHGRPTRLSDPHFDFTPSLLADLLAVPDEKMAWQHFSHLLGPHLPAGTYEETEYFFPRAVDYLLANHDAALDLITPVVGFVSNNAAELHRDGLLDVARDGLRLCFTGLTNRFEVQHFDSEACAAKGWRLSYFDCVTNQEAVCQGTTDLARFATHVDLAEEFVQSLAHHDGNPTRAAWFLEYAHSVDAVYTPPDHPPIRALLSDKSLLDGAAAVVRESLVPQERSPTYWRDTFVALSLLPHAGA